MKISPDTLKATAALARIDADDQTLRRLSGQLADIIGYIEQLEQLNTDEVPARCHVLELTNVFRPDARTESLHPESALANAPEQEQNHFKVPKVI